MEDSTGAVGSPWEKDLYDLFAPVRAEIEAAGYTEQEMDALIDEAISEVRARRA